MEDKSIRFDEINMIGLLRALIKNLWVILLVCISAVMLFTSYSRITYTPRYTSSATFMVSAKDSTSAYNSLTITQNMATVFVEVFQSNVLREKIQAQMPDQVFDGTINTTTIPETNILIVTATSTEPDTAFHALTLAVENYSEVSEYLFSNAQLEVIKDPIIPTRPSNPLQLDSKYPYVLLIGALLAVIAIVMIQTLRDTVQNPKSARRKLDARLLRTVTHEEKNKTLRAKYQRKNTAPLIVSSMISKSFIADNLSLCSTVEYHAKKHGQKVIMVTSVGENEGKSTVAANLALAMAEKNRRVFLLDCDFRKPSLHKIFELSVPKQQTLSHYLSQDSQDPVLYANKHGVALGLSHNSGKSIHRLLNNGKLDQLLKKLRKQADYVILDTPPMLAAADAEAIAAMCDTALLVARADFMPASAINDGLDRLRKSAPDVCGYVLNNYRTKIW